MDNRIGVRKALCSIRTHQSSTPYLQSGRTVNFTLQKPGQL